MSGQLIDPREALEGLRKNLERFKRGEGLDPSDQSSPEQRKRAARIIARFLDVADYVIDGPGISKVTKKQLRWDFVQTLLAAANANLQLALFSPSILRTEFHLASTRSPRGSHWPELDDWLREALTINIKAAAKQLWKALPDSEDGHAFYRDGDQIYNKKDNRELGFSGFQSRISNIRKELNSR